jgi:hypothetical protein
MGGVGRQKRQKDNKCKKTISINFPQRLFQSDSDMFALQFDMCISLPASLLSRFCVIYKVTLLVWNSGQQFGVRNRFLIDLPESPEAV